MNSKELKEYLKYVKILEAKAYELTRIYNILADKADSLNHKKYPKQEKTHTADEDGGLTLGVLVLTGWGAFIGLFIGLFVGMSHETGFILFRLFKCKLKYLGNGILWGAAIGLIIGIIICIFKVISTKRENKEIVKNNVQIAKNNAAMKEQDKKKVQIIQREMDIIKKQYQETKNLLNKAYSLNILHPKYQNFIAVCSLHEYLVTERCTQLTGHEGGYNIFEMEKRMNLIILKLDEIINKLDQIRENQYELYATLSTSNRNIDKICRQVSVVSEQLGNIEQNQALIEYNSSISANNTEFMKWLSYFQG